MGKIEATYCPLIKKDCIAHKCAWYMRISGMNPNTGEQLDDWGCAIAWLPVLLIENSQQQRQTGAAVESLRNEVNNYNSYPVIVAESIGKRIIEEIEQ
jgi:hypothetical protein